MLPKLIFVGIAEERGKMTWLEDSGRVNNAVDRRVISQRSSFPLARKWFIGATCATGK